jgi:hypothetical protein
MASSKEWITCIQTFMVREPKEIAAERGARKQLRLRRAAAAATTTTTTTVSSGWTVTYG